MLESLLNRWSNLTRCTGGQPQKTSGLGYLCKIWIVQIGSKIDDAGGFHFQFHKRQRAIVEDNKFDRSRNWRSESRSPISIVRPPSPDKRHNLTVRDD